MVRKKNMIVRFYFLFFIFLVNKFEIFADVVGFAPIHNENEKQKSVVCVS